MGILLWGWLHSVSWNFSHGSRMNFYSRFKNKLITIHSSAHEEFSHKSVSIKPVWLTFILFFYLFPANPKDWSDHALWWPAKNIWLTRTRSTLDQVGLHADALLHFTPMHKILRVQVSYSYFIVIHLINSCK